MATGTVSKADLQDQIDRAISTLEDAYTPEIEADLRVRSGVSVGTAMVRVGARTHQRSEANGPPGGLLATEPEGCHR